MMDFDNMTQATAGAIELADELGIDLAGIKGTGNDGNVTKYDVQRHHQSGLEKPVKEDQPVKESQSVKPGAGLNRSEPMAECFGRADGLKFIQGGRAYDSSGKFLGTVDPATNDLNG